MLGDSDTLGKPVGDDLREGKPTELLAYAMANANAEQAEKLALVGTEDLSVAQVAELVDVLTETGAVAENEAEITRLVTEAAKVLADIPFRDPAKTALATLAEYVAARTY